MSRNESDLEGLMLIKLISIVSKAFSYCMYLIYLISNQTSA